MKLPSSVCVFVVVAVGCQCGGVPSPCEGVTCGPGLQCSPSTGRCVSEATGGGGGSAGGGGGSTDDAGLDAGACPTACTGATPVCDTAAGRCVVCASANDCPIATPICLATVQPAGACVECRTLLDCPGARDCDPVMHVCLPDPDAGTGGGGGTIEPVVYGHTATTLYKVNATTKLVTAVADFSNCDSEVIDLALDEHSRAFVTTQTGLFQLNLMTAACTSVKDDSYPNSLSFVPKGTLDPNVEALVGYNGSSYVRINPLTGAVQQLDTLGGGFVSSGDIVSVIDGGTYLTAKNPGSSSADFLIEVNPATGALVRSLGPLPFADVFGLAFWGGSLYGFSHNGTLFEITINGSMTTSAAVPNAMAHPWNGAGSTTAAALR